MEGNGQYDIQRLLGSIAESMETLAQKNDVEEIHAKFQEFKYQQSSKFSEISRKLIIGILGGAWAASLKDGNFSEWNSFLIITLLVSCIYLGVDAIHYFSDAEEYKKICDIIRSTKSLDGINNKQESVAESSNCFFVAKLILLVLGTICFVIGFMVRYI